MANLGASAGLAIGPAATKGWRRHGRGGRGKAAPARRPDWWWWLRFVHPLCSAVLCCTVLCCWLQPWGVRLGRGCSDGAAQHWCLTGAADYSPLPLDCPVLCCCLQPWGVPRERGCSHGCGHNNVVPNQHAPGKERAELCEDVVQPARAARREDGQVRLLPSPSLPLHSSPWLLPFPAPAVPYPSLHLLLKPAPCCKKRRRAGAASTPPPPTFAAALPGPCTPLPSPALPGPSATCL